MAAHKPTWDSYSFPDLSRLSKSPPAQDSGNGPVTTIKEGCVPYDLDVDLPALQQPED